MPLVNRLFLFLFLLCSSGLKAQKAKLRGSIQDTLGNPLVFANILAFPDDESLDPSFGISNEKGIYQLDLFKNQKYMLKVSFLGFQPLELPILLNEDQIRDIRLLPMENQLDEVVVEYKIPVEIKKDTITYQTEAFLRGDERKLREVLKRLPGIEVDREGNVLAQGRKVTKVLVENEEFFTGDSKLAVNNIPADAVQEVQVLENYNKVGFMKELENSQQIALNINLKEGKKKFIFGDVKAGLGPDNRYSGHLNSFSFAENTNIHGIVDANNVGYSSFTLKDYLNFNGGVKKLLRNTSAVGRLRQQGLESLLNSTEYKDRVENFAAINFRHKFSDDWSLNTFIIGQTSENSSEEEFLYSYLRITESPLEEVRTQTGIADNLLTLGKLSIVYDGNKDEFLEMSSFWKGSESNRQINISSLVNSTQSSNTTTESLEGIETKQYLDYNRRFSSSQTISLLAEVGYSNTSPMSRWQSDQELLSGQLPLLNSDMFDLRQDRNGKNILMNVILKDYWVLGKSNHLYSTLGTSFNHEEFNSRERQFFSDDQVNVLEGTFGNQLKFNHLNTFLGLEHKIQLGEFTIKTGANYHTMLWDNRQAESQFRNTRQFILPSLEIEGKIRDNKLKLDYEQEIRLPTAERLSSNFMVSSFNTLFQGNPNLEFERFHNLNLSLNKFNFFRGKVLNMNFTYRLTTESFKSRTELNGIDQITEIVPFDENEQFLSFSLLYSKRIRPFKFKIRGVGSYREFFQLLNEDVNKNRSRGLQVLGSVSTDFKNAPNVEVSYNYRPSAYSSTNTTTRFNRNEFNIYLESEFLQSFKFVADYRYTGYKNISQNTLNQLELFNASIRFNKEDSPWTFVVDANNILNVRFSRRNSFSDFIITDQTTFILPRIVLWSVEYKF